MQFRKPLSALIKFAFESDDFFKQLLCARRNCRLQGLQEFFEPGTGRDPSARVPCGGPVKNGLEFGSRSRKHSPKRPNTIRLERVDISDPFKKDRDKA